MVDNGTFSGTTPATDDTAANAPGNPSGNPNEGAGQTNPQSESQQLAQAPGNSVNVLTSPGDGEVRTFNFDDTQLYQAPTNVTLSANPGNAADLVITFPDGGRMILPGYLALISAGLPPALELADGTMVGEEYIIASIGTDAFSAAGPAAGGDDGATGEAAPGAGTGGGAAFGLYSIGTIGDGIDPLLLLSGLGDVSVGLRAAAARADVTDLAEGSLSVEIVTTFTDVSVPDVLPEDFNDSGGEGYTPSWVEGRFDGGFEDSMANADEGWYGKSYARVIVQMTPADNETFDTTAPLTIIPGDDFFAGNQGAYPGTGAIGTDFETDLATIRETYDGWLLVIGEPGTPGSVLVVPNGDGEFLIDVTDVALSSTSLGNMFLIPPEHADGNVDLSVDAVIVDPDSLETATLTDTVTVVLDAVADKAEFKGPEAETFDDGDVPAETAGEDGYVAGVDYDNGDPLIRMEYNEDNAVVQTTDDFTVGGEGNGTRPETTATATAEKTVNFDFGSDFGNQWVTINFDAKTGSNWVGDSDWEGTGNFADQFMLTGNNGTELLNTSGPLDGHQSVRALLDGDGKLALTFKTTTSVAEEFIDISNLTIAEPSGAAETDGSIYDIGFTTQTPDQDGSETISRVELSFSQLQYGLDSTDEEATGPVSRLLYGGDPVHQGGQVSLWAKLADGTWTSIEAAVSYSGDVVTFTILDENGNPLVDHSGGTDPGVNSGSSLRVVEIDFTTFPTESELDDIVPVGESPEPQSDEGGYVEEDYQPGLQMQLPQHLDDDFDFTATTTTNEFPTDGDLTDLNNQALSQATFEIEVKAVADKVDFVVPGDGEDDSVDDTVTFSEDDDDTDGANDNEDSLTDTDGNQLSGVLIGLAAEANLLDRDGSERVQEIVITREGGDDSASFVRLNDDGQVETIETGDEITLKGVTYTAEVSGDNGRTLALTFKEATEGSDPDFVLDGDIKVHVTGDDSSDFAIRYDVTTREVAPDTDNTDGTPIAHEEETTSTTVNYTVEGVAETASGGFETDATWTYDEDGGDTNGVRDSGYWKTSANGQVSWRDWGQKGVEIPVAFIAGTQDEDAAGERSEAITSVLVRHDGQGAFEVKGDGDGNGEVSFVVDGETYTATYVIHDGQKSLAANGTLGDVASGGETLVFTFRDQSGAPQMLQGIDLTELVSVKLGADDSTDFDLNAQVVTSEYDDGESTTPVDTHVTTYAAQDVEVKGVAETAWHDFSYNASHPASISEDNGITVGAADGGVSIGVRYVARATDGDAGGERSEGVYQIVLTHDSAEGAFQLDDATPTASGTVTVLAKVWDPATKTESFQDVTADYTIADAAYGNGQTLTLYFQTPYITVVREDHVSDVVSVRLPNDDSSDFTLTGKTVTVEYDDDNDPTQNYADGAEETPAFSTTQETAVINETITVNGVAETVSGGFDANATWTYDEDGGDPIGNKDGSWHGTKGVTVAVPFDPFATQDDDDSEGISQIVLTHEGDGRFVFDGVSTSDSSGERSGSTKAISSHDAKYTLAADGKTLTVDFGTPADVQSANLADLVQVQLGNDDSSDFDITARVTTTDFDDDGNGTDTHTTTFSQAVTVQGVAESGSAWFWYDKSFTKEANTIVFDEDGGSHKPEGDGVRVPVRFSGTTRDSDAAGDQSEGVYQIVLTHTSDDGTFVVDADDGAADEVTINGHTATFDVSEAGKELTLTFAEPGIQAIRAPDMGQKVFVEVASDDSKDFTISGHVVTVEYDDDVLPAAGSNQDYAGSSVMSNVATTEIVMKPVADRPTVDFGEEGTEDQWTEIDLTNGTVVNDSSEEITLYTVTNFPEGPGARVKYTDDTDGKQLYRYNDNQSIWQIRDGTNWNDVSGSLALSLSPTEAETLQVKAPSHSDETYTLTVGVEVTDTDDDADDATQVTDSFDYDLEVTLEAVAETAGFGARNVWTKDSNTEFSVSYNEDNVELLHEEESDWQVNPDSNYNEVTKSKTIQVDGEPSAEVTVSFTIAGMGGWGDQGDYFIVTDGAGTVIVPKTFEAGPHTVTKTLQLDGNGDLVLDVTVYSATVEYARISDLKVWTPAPDGGDETHTFYDIGFVTKTGDRDGSETLSKVQLQMNGLAAAGALAFGGDVLKDGDEVALRANVVKADGSKVVETVYARVDLTGSDAPAFVLLESSGGGDLVDASGNVGASGPTVYRIDFTREGGTGGYPGLQMQLPQHLDDDFSFDVTTTTTESANGHQETSEATFNVDIKAVADAPVVTATGDDNPVNEDDAEGPLVLFDGEVIEKTFDFETAMAGQTVTITFDAETFGGWDTTGGIADFLEVTHKRFSGDFEVLKESDANGFHEVDVVLDDAGRATLAFMADATFKDEGLVISNFRSNDGSFTATAATQAINLGLDVDYPDDTDGSETHGATVDLTFDFTDGNGAPTGSFKLEYGPDGNKTYVLLAEGQTVSVPADAVDTAQVIATKDWHGEIDVTVTAQTEETAPSTGVPSGDNATADTALDSAATTETFTITVAPVNDAPVIEGTQVFSASFDTAFEGTVFNDLGGSSDVVGSGTNSIETADGKPYLQVMGDADGEGVYTPFDHYRGEWPGEYTAEIKVYLDPNWTHGEGFQWSVASSGSDGKHQRDFIFHVTKDTSTEKLLVAGNNNATSELREDLDTNFDNYHEVTESGWYTLQHHFYEQDGQLSVDMNLVDAQGTILWTETRTTNQDTMDQIGGNRYGWFTEVNVTDGLAVDGVNLTLSGATAEVTEDGARGVMTQSPFGDVAGIEEAGPSNIGDNDKGDLEPASSLLSTSGVNEALTKVGDPADPTEVASALADLRAIESLTDGQAFAIMWDHLDDQYYDTSGYNNSDIEGINEAFVRLGVEYARYLKDGGDPLVEVTAQYQADGGHYNNDPYKDDGVADRSQSMHDNLLTNLSAFTGRVDDANLTELRALVASVDPTLLERDGHGGYQADTNDALKWDQNHGYLPAATGAVIASDVDGDTLRFSVDNATGAYGSLVINPDTGVWGYTVDYDAVQALGGNDEETETFTITVSDDNGGTDTQTLTIIVKGQDDGAASVTSTSGDDILIGNDHDDNISGDDGDDIIYGDAGDDDLLHGNAGDDSVFGGAGDDLLRGGKGDDTLDGGDGEDELFGDKHDDVLYGGDDGLDADELTGDNGSADAGNDVFRVGPNDAIMDFGEGEDAGILYTNGMDGTYQNSDEIDLDAVFEYLDPNYTLSRTIGTDEDGEDLIPDNEDDPDFLIDVDEDPANSGEFTVTVSEADASSPPNEVIFTVQEATTTGGLTAEQLADIIIKQNDDSGTV